jgi:hypothetical protein
MSKIFRLMRNFNDKLTKFICKFLKNHPKATPATLIDPHSGEKILATRNVRNWLKKSISQFLSSCL